MYKCSIKIVPSNSRRQPYVTLSLLSTANATALPATSGARGTECYRRSVSIVSLVVGVPFASCLRESNISKLLTLLAMQKGGGGGLNILTLFKLGTPKVLAANILILEKKNEMK